MNAVTEVSNLILCERQARDRGWWTTMSESFLEGAPVFLSWIDGTAEEFVAGSVGMFDAGERPVHRLAPPAVTVAADRAVAEVGAAIANRITIGGVQADLVSHCRLLYQVCLTGGAWRIASLTGIYENGTLTPSWPGTAVPYDLEVLRGIRYPFRYLGYYLAISGRQVPEGLYGDDEPERLAGLYRHAFAWLHDHDLPPGRPVAVNTTTRRERG
ncbi:nuclear transport factor 2 family protein [Lentzea sp. NPDC058436]|uniref:nuclear transport factor 2 family protein n=1 Tax=Lentzea sp. NPDC058436 TaxID=3346499 RepID=UPI00366679AE